MSKELVIGSNRHETKVAIVEEDQLVEVYFQRANEYSLAGSIHKGRVTRVLPGMQSAFVDLGLERDTFLYVSDFFEENEDIDTVTEDKPPVRNERNERNDRNDRRDRGDRNDRGDRDRGQNRVAERPPEVAAAPESREQRSPIAERVPVITEPSPLIDAEPSLETAPEAGTNAQAADKGPNDRGGFRGERRGRRSRRRRTGGQGFPDNKYAQPGGSSTERQTAPASGPEVHEDSIAEVIVLPGESLAKYRHAPEPSHGSSFAGKSEFLAAVPDPVSMEEPEYDPQEDLEAEAEEIELTDKIFSHQEISNEAEEEKIDFVKDDQPETGFVVEDVEAEDFEEPPSLASEEIKPAAGLTVNETAVIDQGELPSFSASRFTEEVRAEKLAGSLDEEQFAAEPMHVDLLEVEDFEIQEEAENEADSAHAAALEGAEANAELGTEAAAGTAEGGSTQSAVLREQGGRNMYRTSRRMRRRRGGSGGNRFGNEAPKAESTPEFVSGGGAAPAVQPVAKIEPRREFDDERPERPDRVMPSISDLLKAGQEIIVQIAKEPLGQKGARITSHIALPGRYVVFMPSVNHLGVSRKVGSDEERQRLKRILQTHRVGTSGGFIVRTAGEGVPEEEIAADMNFLYSLWLDIRQKAEKKPAPALLHYDLDIVQRILRDQVTEEFKAIWVDNEDLYESILTFLQRFQPALVSRVKMYTRSAPIFDAFNITQELEKALRPKVWLKSGGYIVINQTEALVAIDINTGKYVGKSNRLEDTIVKTNTEAVKEIVRQVRLRDLGGIIVVDFIDMDERKNRQKVMQALEEAMQADRAPYKILQFNDFGLVAITRKRVKQSLERTLCAPCPHCEGAGYVKSVQTIVGEILVEAQKIARAIEGKDVVLRANPEVAKVIKASTNRYLEELEETLGRPVLVVSDASLHSEKFDLA